MVAYYRNSNQADKDGYDGDYGSLDTEEEEQGLVEQDEENEQEDQQHDHMFVSPLHKVTWISQTMNKAASTMQIEKKMKKLYMNVKMIAVVDGAQPPFTAVYSLWKARDGCPLQ